VAGGARGGDAADHAASARRADQPRAPALSPDGRRIAFLSERGRLDVELWLADAETGEVIRRLVRGAALRPPLRSLNFIASAGSFSPDGRQLAFSALRRGRERDRARGRGARRVTRQIPIPGVPEITNPTGRRTGAPSPSPARRAGSPTSTCTTWRPAETRQLTSGRNADLMPAFSPDGATIAFVTDRGPGTDLDALRFGGYRIALVEVATGEIRVLPGEGDRNFNPTWTADGRAVFFLSDRTGIANVYRADVATGALAQVTEIFQGISGITRLSPALTSARTAERLVFSVFQRGGYNLYRLDDATRLAGEPLAATMAEGDADMAPLPAVLPPAPRPAEEPFVRVLGYLGDPLTGLPSPEVAAAWAPEPTAPGSRWTTSASRRSASRPAAPSAAAGCTAASRGSGATCWRGTRCGARAQAQGQLDEFGFSAAYLYRRLRWDFGVAAQRVPYFSGYQQQGFDAQAGLFRDQVITFRTFDWRLLGLAQLPLSHVQRVEFSAGPRRLARDVRIQEVVYDPIVQGGQIVGLANPRFQETREDGEDFNLFEGSAALVFDNALFGFTSPFAGQRYRLEVSPTLGSFRFVNGLADYRRYLWLQPFTLAGRAFHFGRYGLRPEDEQTLGPLFLGQPQLLRGYPYGDLVNRCRAEQQATPQATESCAVLDQLFGSRLAVANLELRFPLIQALVFGGGIGIPPIEGFAFYDAGVAWGRGTQPVLAGGIRADPEERGLLSSAGVGGRVNLLGYAILEVGYLRAFAGDLGWRWHLALQPGF
jgi:hypothetical protein